MVEGPADPVVAALGTALVLAFIYFPLVMIGLYAFNDNVTQAWPIQNWTHEVVQRGVPGRGCARRVPPLGQGGGPRDAGRARARHCALVRGRPLPLLRAADDLVPRRAADRAARDRHRPRAERDDRHRARADRDRLRAAHDRDRPRDLLHRRRLQQRHRAAAPDGALVRGGVLGSRRRLAGRRSGS